MLHTAAAPPKLGSSARPTIGCSEKPSAALTNAVTAKSATARDVGERGARGLAAVAGPAAARAGACARRFFLGFATRRVYPASAAAGACAARYRGAPVSATTAAHSRFTPPREARPEGRPAPVAPSIPYHGRTVTVRLATPGDLPGLHALGLAILADGRGQVTTLEHADDMVAHARRIEGYFGRPDDAAIFVAVDDEGIAGEGLVRRYQPALTRHAGVLSLGVHPRAQRRGYGRALVRAMCAWANGAGLRRLELFMRADNARARALYESEGFVHEGTRARFVRLPDGTEVDDLILVRFFA